VFLRLWCYPPPPAPFEPRDEYESKMPPMQANPLGRLRRVFGARFEQAVRDKVVVDVGCGAGAQVIGAVQAGGKLGVGIDKVDISIRIAIANAAEQGVADRVRFTTEPVSTFGAAWADVAVSQNSFEHFRDPGEILRQVYEALKPGGTFFVTFGPTWWHPYGVHHMFMIRMPWAHCLFSEKTILRVRQLYRPDKPMTWPEVSLNRISVRKFLELVRSTGFTLDELILEPIGPLPRWLVKLAMFREWTTTATSVILTKPGSGA
jgi:SAM-dependent methyltransferase